MTAGLATLREAQEFYSVQDMWDLIEVAAVRVHNEREAVEEAERDAKRKS